MLNNRQNSSIFLTRFALFAEGLQKLFLNRQKEGRFIANRALKK